jgi:hypothetical protein
MRHQVVLFPFLVLLFGMGLDWIIRATGRFGMAAVPAIVAAVTVVWCVRGLTSDYRGSLLDPPWPRFERQYAALQPHLRPGQVLYLTHYAQFGFFSQTMTHRWSCTVRPRFGVYDYSIADGSVAWRAIVDREVWQPRWPVGPESADRLASLMRESALRELLVVSWVNGKAAEANPNGRDDTIRNLAARGLVMDRWFRIGDGYAFVLASSGR